MILYVYDKNTKEYKGEVEANLDPLESALQGREIFVIPPYCTVVKPQTFVKNKVNVYNEKEKVWVLVEDNRGLTVYNKKTKEATIIKDLGAVSSEFAIDKPFDLQEGKDKAIEDLNVAYSKAQGSTIKIGKIEANLDDRFNLARALDFLNEEYPTLFFDMKDKSVEINKEDIKKIIKKLHDRSMFLPRKRNEILDKIKSARSKKALDTISEEIKEFK